MENNPDALLKQIGIDINEMKSINDLLLDIDKKQREEAKKVKSGL